MKTRIARLAKLALILVTLGASGLLARATSISLVNPSFELNTSGQQITTKNTNGFSGEVQGWLNAGSTYNNSGLDYAGDNGNIAQSGTVVAYCDQGDSGAYQITGYQMTAGDTLTLTWWAKSTWDNASQSVKLLKGATTTTAYSSLTVLATSTAALSNTGDGGAFTQYTLTYTATSADAGNYVAVSFMAPGTAGSWATFDSFSLGVAGLGGNALDRLNFGDTGADFASESGHSFNSGLSGSPFAGTGALGQTYRAPVGGGPGTGSNELEFTMAVSPTLQNYLTVRLWGSDVQEAQLWLSGTNYGGYGFMDDNGQGGPASFPNRFYYTTMAIPIAMTTGKTSVQLVLYENNTPNTTYPARPVYSAYTHTDPHFVSDANQPTGTKMVQTGQATLNTLTSAVALGTTSTPGLLMTNRQDIYSVSNNYYSQILARQIPSGQAGAPPEVIGLDLHTNVATWAAANPNATADQWRDAVGGGGWGPGYSDVPDEMLSVLTATYLLPQFTDQNGNVVTGLDHYHDSTIIPKIVACLDGCTYLQSSDGTFDNSGGNDKNGVSTTYKWQGLTSTPRATGQPYAGTTSRGTGWSITLEGCDTATLGWTITQLLNDPTAAPIFESYLTQTGNFDLDGTTMERAYAYERMLNNQITFYTVSFDGGVDSQALFDVTALYSCWVALEKLQALYPYPSNNSTFPNDNYTYNMPYPVLTGTSGVTWLEQMMGLSPLTSAWGSLYSSSYTNYALSLKGIGEGHGTLSGGYDGRYGTILPWEDNEVAQMAGLDPSISSTILNNVRTQARASIDGWDHFVSAQEDLEGLTNHFTFAQEDYVTYRDPYNANSDAGGFSAGTNYLASDPNMDINDAYALRAAYLETQYNILPDTGEGGGSQLQYLKNLASYESTIRSLINVSPTTLTTLPGEPAQANSAWVDVQTGATAVYYNGERFYMNANWDTAESAFGGKYGTWNYIARIHDTLSASDRTSLVYLPYNSATEQSDGNLSGAFQTLWVVRYGTYLIAGNDGSTSTSVKLPSGAGYATEVISGNKYAMGSNITLNAGQSVVLAMPLVISSQPVANGTYTMTNLTSNLVMDDPGSSTTSGTQMDQNTSSGGTNQQWTFTYNGSGYYTIQCVKSGLYLTDPNGSTGNNAKLEQMTADNSSDQLWQLVTSGDGYFFINQAGGTEINDPGSSGNAGTLIILWQFDSGKNSVWSLTPIASTASQPLANGTYTMTCDCSGLLLDNWNSTNSGGWVDQATATGGSSQQWVFTSNGNGYYTIKNVLSGLYLTDVNGNTGNGAHPEQLAADGQGDQLWYLSADGDGYTLVNQTGGTALDDPSSSTTSGQAIDLWTWGGGPNQIWSIH
jgi:hypothetical protein